MSNQQNDTYEEVMAEAQAEMEEPITNTDLAKIEMETPVYQTQQLPEAPYSVTITGYYKGFSTMKTHRSFEPIKNEVVVASIEDMIAKGFLPSWNTETNGKALAKPVETPATPASPVCPYHNKPMTLREGKFGKFWSCSTKLADDTWCKYTPSLKVEDQP